jgi:histone H3/H4
VSRYFRRPNLSAPPAPPPPTPPLPTHLGVAARRIDDALNHNPSRPITLSADARTELEVLHAEYLGDLGQEAVRMARKERHSTVDRTHVINAAERLQEDTSNKFSSIMNSVGGIAAGAGISSVYSILFSRSHHSTAEIAFGIVVSVIGAVLLAIGITSAVVRRRG